MLGLSSRCVDFLNFFDNSLSCQKVKEVNARFGLCVFVHKRLTLVICPIGLLRIIFTVRRYASTGALPWPCLCTLSVRLSQVGVLPNRLNVVRLKTVGETTGDGRRHRMQVEP